MGSFELCLLFKKSHRNLYIETITKRKPEIKRVATFFFNYKQAIYFFYYTKELFP